MPANGAVEQSAGAAQMSGMDRSEDWETKEAVCEGRGTHLILKPSDTVSARLEFARVLVKAPEILGTLHGKRHSLREPRGQRRQQGEDVSRLPATIQHAVNMAADSGTTI